MAYSLKELQDRTPDDVLQDWIDKIDSFEDFIKKGGRNDAIRCRDYFDDRQWTDSEVAQLEAAGQPVVTDNRIKPKIMFILGTEAARRTDPKAFPREKSDTSAADLGTKILRYATDRNKANQKFSDGFEYMNIEGIEAHIVLHDEDGIVHSEIPYNRLVYDPHSSDRFFRDAKWMGTFAYLDIDDALANPNWKNAEDVLENTSQSYKNYQTEELLNDKPDGLVWWDEKRRRVLVFQLYVREFGKWRTGVFTYGGWLEQPTDSPWHDDAGKPSCPIVAGSAFIDRFNDRYSIMRQMLSMQDEINKRRSKALHWADSRQVSVEGAATRDDIETVREEAHKADGVLHVRSADTRISVLDNPAITAVQMEFMASAIESIDAAGPNPSLQGKDARLRSGRAIRANQESGIMELTRVFDAHAYIKERVYEMYWARVKQFWTDEKVVRVTQPNKSADEFVTVNETLTIREAFQRKYPQGIPDAILSRPDFQQRQYDKTVMNAIGNINVDVTVEAVPDVANAEEEMLQLLSDALQYVADPARRNAIADLMIENLPIPDKEETLKRIRGESDDPKVQEQQQAVQQRQQQIENIQIADAEAEVKKKEAEADETEAQAALHIAKIREMQQPQPETANQ